LVEAAWRVLRSTDAGHADLQTWPKRVAQRLARILYTL
jgi:hypothetical protein